MYQRIIVPLDGSDVAAQALPYVRLMAKATGAKVELLEAVHPFPRQLERATMRPYTTGRGVFPPSYDQWTKVQAEGKEAARQRLEAVAQQLRRPGLDVSVRVIEDDPPEAIATAAKEPGSLVVMSTHGRSGIGRWMMGSVTDKVIRSSRQPVLVTRAHEKPVKDPKISRIVVPLDGSESSEAALPHAFTMAKGLGVGITLFRSVSPLVYGDTFADYVPAMYQDLSAEIDAEVEDYLAQAAERARQEGVTDVETRVADGYPASTIVDEVGDAGDKLVVMATHGRSGVERWILGSVTDRVVQHSAGPVLVVQPGK